MAIGHHIASTLAFEKDSLAITPFVRFVNGIMPFYGERPFKGMPPELNGQSHVIGTVI